MDISALKVKIFGDGADVAGIKALAARPYVKGFTTNPTLMRQAGVSDYVAFAREVLALITERPISFEVFSDDLAGMERQAREIASWAPNVYVKVPVTNTRGESTESLVHTLSHEGIKLNVTAILTLDQVKRVTKALAGGAPSNISVFAGRIADTGVDPLPIMTRALEIMARAPEAELIWASPRELLNVAQASAIGCHIITVTGEILKKLPLIGKDLAEYSLETVKMFHDDAEKAGYRLEVR